MQVLHSQLENFWLYSFAVYLYFKESKQIIVAAAFAVVLQDNNRMQLIHKQL